MEELNFPITNIKDTKSRRQYNCYRAAYSSIYEHLGILRPELVVETYVALLPFPTTERLVDNYIYRFLKKINRVDVAKRYELMSFEITTQTIERTLVDKVFALCDYYIQGAIEHHSRHLYDIYKIVDSIGVTDETVKLIPEVKEVRSKLSICPSAKEDICVTDILNEIIEKQAYKSDYEDITMGLLFVPEKYDTVIQSIKLLADSGIWN